MIVTILAFVVGAVVGYGIGPVVAKLKADYAAHKQTVAAAAQAKLAADYAAGKAAAEAAAAKAVADAAAAAVVVPPVV